MQKSKILGIIMISSAIILTIIVIGYTAIFSIFRIKFGGSFLMITPLLIIAIAIIVALSFLFRAGIKQMRK